jgi:hypothetical protein
LHQLPRFVEQTSDTKNEDGQLAASRNKSISSERKMNDDSAINHCNDYSQNLLDKTDMHTLIYDTSVLSKNASDIGNKSAIQKDRYDSEDDNAYDESKSDLFNPMTYTRG